MSYSSLAAQTQAAITSKLPSVVASVLAERSEFYQRHPAPPLEAVGRLVEQCAQSCAQRVLSSQLTGGPGAVLAIVPVVVEVVGDQLRLVYDLAAIHGHTEVPGELLMGIVLLGVDGRAEGVLSVGKEGLTVQTGSAGLAAELNQRVAEQISERILRSVLVRFVPQAAGSALGIWANHLSRKVAQHATLLLSQEVRIVEPDPSVEGPVSPLEFERLKLMISLAQADEELHALERRFLLPLVESPELPAAARRELRGYLESGESPPIDFTAFEEQPGQKLAAIIDLIALARADGHQHPSERDFVLRVGRQLGLSDMSIEELLDTDL
ncbi:MAG: TerB family tellurite resistance protein [Vulcanimicrobiota bacterium]